MTKKSHQHYHLNPLLKDDILKAIRKSAPKGYKKLPAEQQLHDFIHNNPSIMSKLDFPILSEEWYWEHESRLVLMPEDGDMLDRLYKAKFDLGSAEHIRFPSNSFTLAMPANTVIDGVEMVPCHVSWHPFDRFIDDFYKRLASDIDISVSSATQHDERIKDPTLPALSITFVDPDQRMARVRTVIDCSTLPSVLSADSPEEIMKILGLYEHSSFSDVLALDKLELQVQARLIRIVVALGVYYTATAGEGILAPGMPSARSRFTREKTVGSRVMTLRSLANKKIGLPNDDGQITYVEHYRSWHFRQLRHPRYYQGDYVDAPVGSRIVFVSDAQVTRQKRVKTRDNSDNGASPS